MKTIQYIQIIKIIPLFFIGLCLYDIFSIAKSIEKESYEVISKSEYYLENINNLNKHDNSLKLWLEFSTDNQAYYQIYINRIKEVIWKISIWILFYFVLDIVALKHIKAFFKKSYL